jgi:solute carrier family 25 (mitochondrial uncoupling protein), member 8/9
MRNTVMNAVEMVAYDCAKDLVRNYTKRNPEDLINYIFYGFVAGFVGQMVGNPIDIVKTRMMNQGAKYGNALNCASDLYKTAGIMGFYQGIRPGLWRCCSFNIFFFFGVGILRKFWAKRDERQ